MQRVVTDERKAHITGPPGHSGPVPAGAGGHTRPAGAGIFQRLVGAVTRCITAGRFHLADPALATAWAGEVWTMRHGTVTLAVTGILPLKQVRFLLTDMTYRLAIGYGDAPSAARRPVDEGMRDQAPPQSSEDPETV